jgi:hypothetical protein
MADPAHIAALKDISPILAAAITLVGTVGLGLSAHRREVRNLRLELNRGTGRDPSSRAALYREYLASLHRFYEPGDRTRAAYNAWSVSHADTSTQIEVLGLKSIRDSVRDVSETLARIQRDELTGVEDAQFANAWINATEAHFLELDEARDRVIIAMRADVGAGAEA